MPIYEYECSSCHHCFEVMQKVSDPAPSHCPECNESDIKRLVSAPAFQLKGSGWYVTDFKDNKTQKPETPKPDSDAKPSPEKPDSKTETKPD